MAKPFDKRQQQTEPPRSRSGGVNGRFTFGDDTFGDDYGGARDPSAYPDYDMLHAEDYWNGPGKIEPDWAPDHDERVHGYEKIRRRSD